MALNPVNAAHAAQIQAGISGRHRGHGFEFQLAKAICRICRINASDVPTQPVFRGDPAPAIVSLALKHIGWSHCDRAEAVALGSLATAEEGKKWLEVNGVMVRACKSDVLLTIYRKDELPLTVGVSVKQCNNRTPTNAQLYFTTAHAFCKLLRRNGIAVTDSGETALRQFCGDDGRRPLDTPALMRNRHTDPRRYFWEEIDHRGRKELETILTKHQKKITRLLLQKAYLADPITPDIVLHKTKRMATNPQEYALYTVDQLVALSKKYQGFAKKCYSVKKGQYRDPPGVTHEAPRFGIVQMQRGGQKQHPTQLQFNLEAGYFYKI